MPRLYNVFISNNAKEFFSQLGEIQNKFLFNYQTLYEDQDNFAFKFKYFGFIVLQTFLLSKTNFYLICEENISLAVFGVWLRASSLDRRS